MSHIAQKVNGKEPIYEGFSQYIINVFSWGCKPNKETKLRSVDGTCSTISGERVTNINITINSKFLKTIQLVGTSTPKIKLSVLKPLGCPWPKRLSFSFSYWGWGRKENTKCPYQILDGIALAQAHPMFLTKLLKLSIFYKSIFKLFF